MMAAVPDARGERLYSVFFEGRAVRRQETENAEKANDLLAFLNLSRVADEPAGMLSGGQKKLLDWAAC